MAWLVFAGVALAAGAASGAAAYMLTARLPEGVPLTVLTGLVVGVLACAALLLSAPADHREHSSLVPFMALWPTLTGSLIGRGRAREHLAKRGKSAVEDLA